MTAIRWVLGGALALSVSAAAAEEAPRAPDVIAKLFECRAIADSAARLACYDQKVADFDRARDKGEVAVVDRADVRRTRQKLFGFSIPDFGIFGGKRDDRGRDAEEQDEVKELVATIRTVDRGRDGFVITLEDGARWEQTDGLVLGRAPRPGGQVTIKRAALGSFKMNFGIGPWVKARRIG